MKKLLTTMIFVTLLMDTIIGQVNPTSLDFPGNQDGIVVNNNAVFDSLGSELSVCAWFNYRTGGVSVNTGFGKPIVSKTYRIPQSDTVGFGLSGWFWQGLRNLSSGIETNQGVRNLGCIDCIEFNTWHHGCFTFGNSEYALWLDGIKVDSDTLEVDEVYINNEENFQIGFSQDWSENGTAYSWKGEIQDVAVWDRALSDSNLMVLQYCRALWVDDGLIGYWPLDEGQGEVISDQSGGGNHGQMIGDLNWLIDEGISTCENDVFGCTDSTACNYEIEATVLDASCIPSGCLDPLACNFNFLAECEGEACDYTCCPGPGCCSVGLSWDYDLEQCMNYETCQEDLDGDGVIGINDLMELLSSFGTMCEEPETVEFSCGDPMNYHGYDYATVQIGEQCWFAENLRTEHYANGDAVPANLTDSEWDSTTSGAVAVYGEDVGCDNGYSPDGDACDPAWSLNEYGRLYNWYAVDDERGLCPTGWHVPTDDEWTVMTDFLGGSPIAGAEMKTTYGWSQGNNGTNSSGFSGLPGGWRTNECLQAGFIGMWWSSSPSVSSAWMRYLLIDYTDVFRTADDVRYGFSVRCVRD
ncbi:hypothetical protein OAF30_02855 [Flavobacteriales bacterium]|nr:hypothetical protein [Flavobacteriales bacterium]